MVKAQLIDKQLIQHICRLVNDLLSNPTPCTMCRKTEMWSNICNGGVFEPFNMNSIVIPYYQKLHEGFLNLPILLDDF